MIVDPLSAAIARPQAHTLPLEKVAVPEEPRPIQGAAESLNAGLDVNKEKNARNRQISEQNRNPEPRPVTYDARGNPRKNRSTNPRSENEGESVDVFI